MILRTAIKWGSSLSARPSLKFCSVDTNTKCIKKCLILRSNSRSKASQRRQALFALGLCWADNNTHKQHSSNSGNISLSLPAMLRCILDYPLYFIPYRRALQSGGILYKIAFVLLPVSADFQENILFLLIIIFTEWWKNIFRCICTTLGLVKSVAQIHKIVFFSCDNEKCWCVYLRVLPNFPTQMFARTQHLSLCRALT